ncbi:MAG: hypothetical protein ABJP34_06745 [Erythrobacter sp.]
MPELIKNFLKMRLWPFLPKPWDAPDMEFHHGLWNGVSALYADSGRQLGEENTRPFSFNHHVPAETIDCKYKGSREGRPINMSALRTAMQNFDAAAAITQAVRAHHLQKLEPGHRLGIWDLYIIARASIALVAYQKRFARQKGVSATVSDVLTSQYQFISGVFMICRHMMENADAVIAENRPMTADALYNYADQHGIFISFNGMACAGSTKKIHEFLELCNSGSEDKAELAAIVSEPDNWYQYALATIELDCYIERERALRREGHGGVSSTANAASNSSMIFTDIGEYTQRLMDTAPEPNQAHAFRDAALSRQNAILKVLGRPLLRKIASDHIAARMEY